MHWTDNLPKYACVDAVAWARTQPDLATAWRKCRRGDWMMWLLGWLSGSVGDPRRKPLVLCACDCAEPSAHLADDDGQMAIAWCLTLARDWAEDGETDLDDVRNAALDDVRNAALDAPGRDVAAYAVFDAAHVAFSVDASGCASAAAFADAAYGQNTRVQCADIVREHYPEPPRL